MEQPSRSRPESASSSVPSRLLRLLSIFCSCAAVALLVAVFLARTRRPDLVPLLSAVILAILGLVVFLNTRFLSLARQGHRRTAGALHTSEREFQSIFENALDAILIFDDQAICREANPAALALFGATRQNLVGQPVVPLFASAEDFENLREALRRQKQHQGRIKLRRGDRSTVFADFTAKADYLPGRNVMMLRDVTAQKQAEDQVATNLGIARSAWAEADALRKASLAMTQDLRMNYVLDTLLESLSELVPYESAQVLLIEADTRLFLAREALRPGVGKMRKCPLTVDAADYPVVLRALADHRGILLCDTTQEGEWRELKGQGNLRSWMCVPLMASNQALGLLALGHSAPNTFTEEHLRLAKSLAVPAAVAIQNARLYERAEIYGAELERRLSDLHEAQKALEQSEEGRKASEETFKKVFRSSPIAFSITTLAEGRILDVNEAFERRFGYSRAELLGRISTEVGLWEDPTERVKLVDQLLQGKVIRNCVTRFRSKSGVLMLSTYSAETIQIEGQPCLLFVSDDIASPCPNGKTSE
jgi:PAS domain S-box-containing protein